MVSSVGLSGVNAFNTFNPGSTSIYMDESASIFSTGVYPTMGMGYGYGFGLGNDQVYNYVEHSLDNQTSLQFAQQGNQFTLASYNQIMTKELPAMANAIREGEFGKASQIYREIGLAISKKNGEELTEQGQRVDFDQAVKATINNMYRQVNGSDLANDIREAGEGYFTNGFMQGLTLGDHHKNSAEETISYMKGEGIEGYTGKKVSKIIGKIAGGAVSVSGSAAVGAGIAAVIAGSVAAPVLIAGAAIGGVLAIGKWLLSDNTPETVTEG